MEKFVYFTNYCLNCAIKQLILQTNFFDIFNSFMRTTLYYNSSRDEPYVFNSMVLCQVEKMFYNFLRSRHFPYNSYNLCENNIHSK